MDRKISVAMECFVEKDGRYLMLHRKVSKRIMPDVWMAPGGHQEKAEGLWAATRREIEEETGLQIKNLRIRAVGAAYLKDLAEEVFFHFVKADYAGGELIKEPDDGELKWLTPEEIRHLPTLLSEIHEVLDYVVDESLPIVSYRAVYKHGNEMEEFEIER
jgi:8-oxo-dGTP pyrophosphatase MutT (NUDIX family)